MYNIFSSSELKSKLVYCSITKSVPGSYQLNEQEKVLKSTGKTKIVQSNKREQFCCKGYYRRNRECVPKCDDVCENSKCTAPNQCECNEGYKWFNKFR